MKTYVVNIDKTWSDDIIVNAKNAAEAKKKAWEKYCNKKQVKKNHKIYADEL